MYSQYGIVSGSFSFAWFGKKKKRKNRQPSESFWTNCNRSPATSGKHFQIRSEQIRTRHKKKVGASPRHRAPPRTRNTLATTSVISFVASGIRALFHRAFRFNAQMALCTATVCRESGERARESERQTERERERAGVGSGIPVL